VASPSNLTLFRLGAFVILLPFPGAGRFAQQSDPQRIVMAEPLSECSEQRFAEVTP
jgi:hypothetical protein